MAAKKTKKQLDKMVKIVKEQVFNFSAADNDYLRRNKADYTVEALARDIGAPVEQVKNQLKVLEDNQASSKPTGLPSDRFARHNGVVSMTSAQSQFEDENKPVNKGFSERYKKTIAKIHPNRKSELEE